MATRGNAKSAAPPTTIINVAPPASGGVLAQIVDAPRQVADEPEEDVHRRGLDVSARLPAGGRVGAETEQPCRLALRQREAQPNGADLVGGEQTMLLPVDRARVPLEPPIWTASRRQDLMAD